MIILFKGESPTAFLLFTTDNFRAAKTVCGPEMCTHDRITQGVMGLFVWLFVDKRTVYRLKQKL